MKTAKTKHELLDRELSWLSFNARVLQEAEDDTVPLLERLKFLAIFSNNLDEFFRVRVATLRRIIQLKKGIPEIKSAKQLLQKIKKNVIQQQSQFNYIFEKQIIPEFRNHNIELAKPNSLTESEKQIVEQYFTDKIENYIYPLILNEKKSLPLLQDGSLYLAISFERKQKLKKQYALIALPIPQVSRFLLIPGKKFKVILLEDIIRLKLNDIFKSFEPQKTTAHIIKVTRDAELDLDFEIGGTLLDKVKKSLSQRKTAQYTRFIYDEKIQADLLLFLLNKLRIDKDGAIPGGSIHNFKDFMSFPKFPNAALYYPKWPTLPVSALEEAKGTFSALKKSDVLLCYPYNSFNYVINFLREAAIDPNVTSIKISLYRLAQNSAVANALINAVKNGKEVIAVTELRARFMEEHNIYWAQRLREEGIKVIEGIPNFKIHAKLILISRKEKDKKTKWYAHIGTGNLNEDTTGLYCDFSLLTARTKLTAEVNHVFEFIQDFRPTVYAFQYLWVSPINTKKNILLLIRREMENKLHGKPARIILKINSLVDESVTEAILLAAESGVQCDLIIRGICVLPLSKKHPNLRIISIIDKYLEHARLFYFENGGNYEIYMGSADMMQRNLQYRVEVTTPIYDESIKAKLKILLECQLQENVKARILDKEMQNRYIEAGGKVVRSQEAFYRLI